MLFISRRIGRGLFGVVDTDDGVEEVWSWVDIVDFVRKDKLNIEGVISTYVGLDEKVSYVEPYQDPLTRTPAQLKLELLSNVTLKTYGEMITSIVVNDVSNRRSITIKLSDYGSACADCMLFGNRKLMDDVPTMLILDDSVSISKHTFDLRNRSISAVGIHSDVGVRLDLTAVTNEDTVMIAYDKVGRRGSMLYIRDHDERKRVMIGMSSAEYYKYKEKFPSLK